MWDLASCPWEAMLADLRPLGDSDPEGWLDAEHSIGLGRAYRAETACAREKPVVRHAGCVVVLDGRLFGPSSDQRQHVGDSQTIVDAYLRWDDECPRHLDGDFAFALWDPRRRRLVCACDAMGRRTLSYFWDGKTFLASSRACSLLRHPRVPRQVNAAYLAHAVGELWAQRPGSTPFVGVRRLRPGFSLSIEGSVFRERQVDALQLDGPPRRVSERAAHAELWATLDASTRSRLKGAMAPCVLLSGGLDSAYVTDLLVRAVGSVDAFSILREPGESVDERKAIEAVLRQYPSVRWHALEALAVVPFGEFSPDLPVLDDPVLAGGATLPARIQAWRAIAKKGFQTVFDGEGADHLFDLSMRFGDLIRTGAWRSAVRYLSAHPAARSVLWRAVIVPHLPNRAYAAWVSLERRRADPLPAWLTPTFRRRRETIEALERYGAWDRRWAFAHYFPGIVESAQLAGSAQAVRLLASSLGLSLASPFLDRHVAEFAARVPAELKVHPAHGKILLRRAAKGRLPDEIRWRTKRERLFSAHLLAALASDQARSLADRARNCGPLAEWVDVGLVQDLLARARTGALPDTRGQRQLRALLAIVAWWERVEAGYGKLSSA